MPFVKDAVDWFVRLQASEGDPETARAFRSWIESNPDHAAAFTKVAAMWGEPELELAASNVAEKTGFTTPSKGRRKSSLSRKAGAGIAIIIMAIGVSKAPDIFLRVRADYVTEVGEQRIVDLPDGSRMTLNAGTAVALDFNDGHREVKLLKGEAYFDVERAPAQAFRVTGQFGRVEVTGTAFDVHTQDDVDTIVLRRGRVEVTRLNRPEERADLTPGDAIGVTNSKILPVRKVDPDQSLAWLEGRISFANRPLEDVIDDLRRYYSGRIFIANPRIARVVVSGNYKLDQAHLIIRSLVEAAGGSMTTLPGGIVILH